MRDLDVANGTKNVPAEVEMREHARILEGGI